MLRDDDIIWIHDYHLIPLAQLLRQFGCANRIGFFLHIPWPSPEVASALPNYQRLLRCFGAYDVVGFQTQLDADNFRNCIVNAKAGLSVGGALCEVNGRWLQVAAFPIGIDVDSFAREAATSEKSCEFRRTCASLHNNDLIIGVDRLDYSKGLKQRIKAFAIFLEQSPEAQRRTTTLQITPGSSRSPIPEYAKMERKLAEEVGRINGKFGDVNWTPLRYINITMSRTALAGLYRMARVGLVTPLRDGMNLVAKEYVAAQAPDDPGVLVLSQFAGAAHKLKTALIVNPYDVEAMADALVRSFAMRLDERKDRWQAMMSVLRANSVHDWAACFLEIRGSDSRTAVSDWGAPSGAARPEPRTVVALAAMGFGRRHSRATPFAGDIEEGFF